ncbi:MAG: hypothetical protein HY706_05525 [Candidatus Hydrogenedentes bacterium]|nr:hypothetical protein [Candidatus Hydrogenedentota bacterium]
MTLSIEIPIEVKRRAEEVAAARGLSLSDLILEALQGIMVDANDPLFTDDETYQGNAPRDLSLNHDTYLCEEGS